MSRIPVPAPIGVLCGGPSTEREISRRSGQAVWRALRELGYDARLIDLPAMDSASALRAAGIRTAFIALHGAFGEDGAVQTLLESLGIGYTGSGVAASRLAIDKPATRARLAACDVPVAAGGLVSSGSPPTWVAAHHVRFPVVVKPARQGSSIGLTIVESPDRWPAALAEAARYDAQIVCEEYLEGPEVTVGILGDAALPVVQVVPQRRFYDYVAKYTPGMTQYLVPAPLEAALTAQVQATALRAHRALACEGFSRVDLIAPVGRPPVVLEVNTIPGLTATSLLPKAAAAAGLAFPQLCERLLASALRAPAELDTLLTTSRGPARCQA
ncbi:MAG: D-alanine--D-alanine ligase [Candidatus Omnitrophica bacterium]|nr:D-alanine--D-alanine ligase [Candidatus Omnitrophota bacterium]